MTPRQIARLLTEDIATDNGLIKESDKPLHYQAIPISKAAGKFTIEVHGFRMPGKEDQDPVFWYTSEQPRTEEEIKSIFEEAKDEYGGLNPDILDKYGLVEFYPQADLTIDMDEDEAEVGEEE
jgi:hypothetical protein